MARKKGITVARLESAKEGEYLFCLYCGQELSANPRDWTFGDQDWVFTCCDEPMVLAKRVIKIVRR